MERTVPPATPTDEAASKVAHWVTPVAGEIAQPAPWLVRSPSIAVAIEKPDWLKLARAFWSFTGADCLASAFGAAATSSSVSTKLPSEDRPGPLLGNFSSARTS